MNVYRAKRFPEGVVATVNGDPLNPRFDLANHSPTGFEFGYGGSGPAQLALAILAREMGAETALRHYQNFKWAFIAPASGDTFLISSLEIQEWLDAQALEDAAPALQKEAVAEGR